MFRMDSPAECPPKFIRYLDISYTQAGLFYLSQPALRLTHPAPPPTWCHGESLQQDNEVASELAPPQLHTQRPQHAEAVAQVKCVLSTGHSRVLRGRRGVFVCGVVDVCVPGGKAGWVLRDRAVMDHGGCA